MLKSLQSDFYFSSLNTFHCRNDVVKRKRVKNQLGSLLLVLLVTHNF